jgi:hypothetical protein
MFLAAGFLETSLARLTPNDDTLLDSYHLDEETGDLVRSVEGHSRGFVDSYSRGRPQHIQPWTPAPLELKDRAVPIYDQSGIKAGIHLVDWCGILAFLAVVGTPILILDRAIRELVDGRKRSDVGNNSLWNIGTVPGKPIDGVEAALLKEPESLTIEDVGFLVRELLNFANWYNEEKRGRFHKIEDLLLNTLRSGPISHQLKMLDEVSALTQEPQRSSMHAFLIVLERYIDGIRASHAMFQKTGEKRIDPATKRALKELLTTWCSRHELREYWQFCTKLLRKLDNVPV